MLGVCRSGLTIPASVRGDDFCMTSQGTVNTSHAMPKWLNAQCPGQQRRPWKSCASSTQKWKQIREISSNTSGTSTNWNGTRSIQGRLLYWGMSSRQKCTIELLVIDRVNRGVSLKALAGDKRSHLVLFQFILHSFAGCVLSNISTVSLLYFQSIFYTTEEDNSIAWSWESIKGRVVSIF